MGWNQEIITFFKIILLFDSFLDSEQSFLFWSFFSESEPLRDWRCNNYASEGQKWEESCSVPSAYLSTRSVWLHLENQEKKKNKLLTS